MSELKLFYISKKGSSSREVTWTEGRYAIGVSKHPSYAIVAGGDYTFFDIPCAKKNYKSLIHKTVMI